MSILIAPFGNRNLQSRKFVTHGIKIFRPRLIVLIVPELGELQDYEVIHKDLDMVCGKQCFFIPGTANLTIKTDTEPAFIVYRRIDEKWLCILTSSSANAVRHGTIAIGNVRRAATAFLRADSPATGDSRAGVCAADYAVKASLLVVATSLPRSKTPAWVGWVGVLPPSMYTLDT